MPRASDGTYSLPNGTLVTTGETILVSQHNPAMADLAQAMTKSLDRSGNGGMLASLDMGGYNITNALNASFSGALVATGTVQIADTTASNVGVVFKGSSRFIHNYPASPTSYSTFMGINAGNFTHTSVSSSAFGYEALRDLTSGQLNSAFGTRALQRVTAGGVNSAFGADTLATLTTGTYNNGFGCKALANATTGSRNNAFGQSCLWGAGGSNTGSENCGFGQDVMIGMLTGNNNCGYGNQTLTSLTGANNNSAFGHQVLYSSTAADNSAFGFRAMFKNTTGTLNAAFGNQTLYENTTGSYNTAFGSSALGALTTGVYNVALGWRAGNGQDPNEPSIVDTYCTFIGPFASRDTSVPSATPLNNATAIGNGAKVAEDNQVAIGNALVRSTLLRGNVRLSNTPGVPVTPIAGVGQIYVEGGALKFMGGSGTVTTLAPA
jgi:hypothetical protein